MERVAVARRLMCGDPVSHHGCEPLHFDARRRVRPRANIDGVEVAKGLLFYRIQDHWITSLGCGNCLNVEPALLGRRIIYPRIRITV